LAATVPADSEVPATHTTIILPKVRVDGITIDPDNPADPAITAALTAVTNTAAADGLPAHPNGSGSGGGGSSSGGGSVGGSAFAGKDGSTSSVNSLAAVLAAAAAVDQTARSFHESQLSWSIEIAAKLERLPRGSESSSLGSAEADVSVGNSDGDGEGGSIAIAGVQVPPSTTNPLTHQPNTQQSPTPPSSSASAESDSAQTTPVYGARFLRQKCCC
jgi:hypothetical protein